MATEEENAPTTTSSSATAAPAVGAATAAPRRVRRLPRTTGALSGLLIVLLGLWGGLIPFIGPYFHYAFGSDKAWHFTTSRLWLDVLPGAAAVLAGLLLLMSSRRISGLFAGWLAVAAGAWFAVGPTVSLLWHGAGDPIGRPLGGHARQALELLGYSYALGVAIVALAAFAMGRFISRPRLAEDALLAARKTRPARRRTGLFGRRRVAA
jgi:hypothetical protein